MRDEKRYLLDIAECIERIEEYTRDGVVNSKHLTRISHMWEKIIKTSRYF